CLTVTAVQRERDSQFFSVITAELEPVRAPSLITFSQPLCLYVPVSMAVQQVFAQATAHSGA
ncbi:TPA: hypothetical protein ACULE5_005082, partial [Escherichia coli]